MLTSKTKIKFQNELSKKIYKNGALLNYQTDGSSGIDLKSVSICEYDKDTEIVLINDDSEKKMFTTDGNKTLRYAKEFALEPGQRAMIKVGFCAAVPKGLEIQIRSRSGLSWKSGVMVLNSPGTIDSDYRGEIGALVINTSQKTLLITQGLRIAQMIIAPISVSEIEAVDELDKTERNTGGFGSTGLK
ncbi:dUTP diphosphatase [Rickettsiales bacterium]|nr:dUTP diphosphatase [Rickettsiales bacterium]